MVRLRVSKSALQVARIASTSKDPTSPVVQAVTTFKHAFVSGDFFINEGLLMFMFFSGCEAEYVDILPLGMGFYFGRWCTLLRLSHRCVQFPTSGTCHRDDTGASGRRVSFKLPWLGEQLWLSSSRSRARARVSSILTVEDSPTVVRGLESHNCSQRVMVLWRHFQAMRPSVSHRGGQSPRYRETHGTGVRTSGIVGCRDHGVVS